MSKIKQCFTSRFDEGFIVEADFSQLEVIGQAVVTGDETLKSDIRNGLDMHCLNAEFLYGVPYKEIKSGVDAGVKKYIDMRQNAKAPSFLRQYGGGANLLAKKTGFSRVRCQKFIDKYYERYPKVKEWQDMVAKEVLKYRGPSKYRTKLGLPAMVGSFKSITGRRYVFREYDGHMGGTSFSPTEMKNYPIQGFATGDIVPEVLGKIFRVICAAGHRDRILLVNTVHDSIVLDVEKHHLEAARAILEDIMEATPDLMKNRFGIDIDLPIHVDIGWSNNWGECK